MRPATKRLFLWFIAIFTVGMVLNSFTLTQIKVTLPFSDLVNNVEHNEISSVEISGGHIKGITKSGAKFETYAPYQYDGLANKLIQHGVRVVAVDQSPGLIERMLPGLFALLVMGGIILFIFRRQMQGGVGGTLNFAKSRAKLQKSDSKKVTFVDVAGVDEAKEAVNYETPF